MLFATVGAGVGFSCLGYILGPLVVPLQEEFGWGRGEITQTSLWSSLGMAAALPLLGRLLDRYGVRRIAWISLPLFAAVLFLLSRFDSTLLLFLTLYALAGIIGVGTSAVTYSKAVVERFHKHRGLALGIMATGLGAAGLLLPPLMGTVIAAYGWRGAYLTMSVLALAPLLILAVIRLTPSDAGSTPSAVSAGHLPGLSRGQALRNREFWTLIAAFFVLGWALLTMVPHFVPMLIDNGVAPVQAALLSSLIGVGTVIGRPIVGWLLDRFYATYVAVPLFLAAAAGCLLLLFGGAGFAPLTAVLIGIGFGAEIDLMSYLSSRYFGQRDFGALYSYVYSAFMIGSAFGPVTAGYLFDARQSYNIPLIIAAAFLVLGSAVLLTLPRFDRVPDGGTVAGREDQAAVASGS
ncbi:MFS transporter [Arthrobacter sp. Sa2CUA1]|uniref:MFS transporter n=1 Tax=Arthrobacter gallicola TaxID=2762225 RepID=A0ABR8UUR5_9MICC|nr:MFS transporter [Arthrobacter gallicola]MBD7996310.1 MFS transporter [Arthrobacter gallicola]